LGLIVVKLSPRGKLQIFFSLGVVVKLSPGGKLHVEV